MGNSKNDTEVKIYRNSECHFCVLKFTTPLKIITNSNTGKKFIVCLDCIEKLKNKSKT